MRSVLVTSIILLLFAVFLYAGYQIYVYWKAENEVTQLNENLIEQAVTPMTKDNTADDATKNVPYTPQGETVPIQVDFEALWQENKDIIAWIYCEGTPIHYPIVQSADNNYYLRRLLNGSYNVNGSIFLDYRNAADFTDFNSVIYGHNMKNGEMFACLTKYKEQHYYDEHPTMYLLTPEQNYRIELVAGYVTPSDSEIYTIPYESQTGTALLAQAIGQSTFVSSAEAKETDCFITLSTCSYEYDDARYVVIGKLTAIE